MKKTFLPCLLLAAVAGPGLFADAASVEFRRDRTDDARIRIDLASRTAVVNEERLDGLTREEAAERARRLLALAQIPPPGQSGKRPLMGWSSWNTFGIEISEKLILDVARAMATNGLKAAGYTYVNIDDGYFGGRDASGRLKIHPQRFPRGLKPVVDGIHALGMKAGIYTDAGSDTCDSLFGGHGDKSGRGSGLYGHDRDDCNLLLRDLGFDFIKVDWCGGQALKLDERTRYTEIARAIQSTGRRDVGFNICRWVFPGTWAADLAQSWRTTGDIRANWKTVKFIIDKNLYHSAYAALGHYNDMDMLEVGQRKGETKTVFGNLGDTGLERDEEITHFGLWCLFSSPLVLGCDVRKISGESKELATNPYLLGMNQNDLGLQGRVVFRDGDACILAKDAFEKNGTSRYVAFYNGTDRPYEFAFDARRLNLGGTIDVFDLVEKSDKGRWRDRRTVLVAPHATKFCLMDASERLPRTVYEAEDARLGDYQELRCPIQAKTAFHESCAAVSGERIVKFLGCRKSNDIAWRDVTVAQSGRYELRFDCLSPDERCFSLAVDGSERQTVRVAPTHGKIVGTSASVFLPAGEHEIRLFNETSWMPDIDRMVVRRTGAPATLPPMKPVYTQPGALDMFTKHGHPQGMACSEKAIYVSCSRGIVKLDWNGRFVAECPARSHLGDIAYANGRLYGAYALREPAEGESPLMIGVWDEDLKPLLEKRYTYPSYAKGFDSCTVLGDTLYTCVDHYGRPGVLFDHPPHNDNTVMAASLSDLSLIAFKDILFDHPIHYATQTMGTDGENLLFGNYGAWKSEGNVRGVNFARATSALSFLDSRRFDAYFGFDRVPEAVSGRTGTVFAVVNALGCGQHGWWRDPEGNPARIRFDFYSYDKATGNMTDITDRSQAGGFAETIFIEENKPIELNAPAWKPGAGDWVTATWGLPHEMWKDFRGFDRLVVDYVNESGEAPGTPLQCYVAGWKGHVNEGLLAQGGPVPAYGYCRSEFALSGWEKAPRTDPSDIGRLHFFLYRPKAVKLKIYRIVLLPKGVECPPPHEALRKKPAFSGVAGAWLSVPDAPVYDGVVGPVTRAASGTSWFARLFTNRSDIVSAKWTVAGLGVFDVYVNGSRVGEDFLKPGYTHPAKTKYAFSYDVLLQLNRAAGAVNALAAEVSAGWWRDKIVTPADRKGFTGRKSAFRGALELRYADGTCETIATDTAMWRCGIGGAVKHAAIFDGEEYDARVNDPLFGEGLAQTPEVNKEFRGELLPSAGGEVALRRDLALTKGPFRLKKDVPLVVDFAQNCAGVPEFRFRAKRGTVLTGLPGEMINDADRGVRGCDRPKGSVYRANLRVPDDSIRFTYTFAGGGWETYHPRFTFFGYRYLSLTATDDVEIEQVATIPVSSIARRHESGRIETGDKDINRFISNVYWGMLSNYLSIPTDCPQRNERLGWMADTQVFCEAGSFIADTRRFFAKFTRDMRDSRCEEGGYPSVAPFAQYGNETFVFGWADAGVIVPWTVWRQFGDTAIVRDNWAAMARFVRRIDETKYDFEAKIPYIFADWLSYEKFETCGNAFGGWERWQHDADARSYRLFIAACYWLYDARLMAEMGRAIGKEAEADEFAQSAARALAYIRECFVETDGLLLKPMRDLQTACVFALRHGIVEGRAREETKALLLRSIRQHGNCLQTGFLGTSFLMDALTMCGAADTAYTLLLQHRHPSWLYSVDQGATTVWERWNSYTKEKGFGPSGMNSFNHYAYGAVVAWLYRTAAGIAADSSAPGFRRIIMAPKPDRRLGWIKAEYKSAAGPVKSAWRYEGDEWVWEFSVPSGATARVTLPGETCSREYAAGDHLIRHCLQK